MSKRQRRWLLGLGVFIAGFILLWGTLPLWFPWVLRPVAGQGGAHYGRYQREGCARFALENVTFTNRSTQVRIERLEAFLPTAWLWHLAIRPSPEPFVRATGWEYISLPGNRSDRSTAAKVREWTEDLQRLRTWVPLAALSNGLVAVETTPSHAPTLPRSDAPTLPRSHAPTSLPVPTLTWQQGELRAQLELPRFNAPTLPRSHAPTSLPVPALTVHLVPAHPYELMVASEPLHWYSTVTLSTNMPGFSLQGAGEWWSNHITFQARFGPTGDWPQTARVEAPVVRLPPSVFHLDNYEDIQGAGSVRWENDQFALDLRAGAQPLTAQTNWPPLQLDLHARGDTNLASIESAVISSPWLKAELSRQVQVHFTGPLLRAPATLRLAADLSRLPLSLPFPFPTPHSALPTPHSALPTPPAGLQGFLNGEADFMPAAGKYPAVRFQLSGTNIGPAQLPAKTLSLRGSLNWPWLQFSEFQARFEDGSRAAADGKLDWEHKRLADGQVQFSGPLLRPWLPAGYAYQHLTVSGRAQGPLQTLSHSGTVEVTGLSSPHLQPLECHLDWNGRQLNFERAQVVVSNNLARLQAQGALEVGQSEVNLLLHTLALSQDGKTVLALEQPARLFAAHTASSPVPPAPPPVTIRLTPFQCRGGAGEVQLQGEVVWPRTGHLQASLRDLHAELLNSFLKTGRAGSPGLPMSLTIQKLALRAGWTNSPVDFSLDLAASVVTNRALSAELQLAGNDQGVRLEKLVFQASTSNALSGSSSSEGPAAPPSNAPPLPRSPAPPLPRSPAPTLRRSDAPTLRRSDAPTLRRSDAPTLPRSHAPTLPRSFPSPPPTASCR